MSGGLRGVAPGTSKREQAGVKKYKAHVSLSPLVTKTPSEVRFIPELERNKLGVRMS
jgi:hypothetical protein